MKKKIYTKPTLSVEEFEMNQIISTSFRVSNVNGGDTGITLGETDPNNGSVVRGKSRGIWDED